MRFFSRSRVPSSCLLLTLSGALAACAPAKPKDPVAIPIKPLSKSGYQEPKTEHPARIVLRESQLKGKADLGAAGLVYFGTGGERWMAPKAPNQPPRQATVFLPEDIATALRAPDGSVYFVGESATVYPAPTALGAPGPKRIPPAGLRAPDMNPTDDHTMWASGK